MCFEMPPGCHTALLEFVTMYRYNRIATTILLQDNTLLRRYIMGDKRSLTAKEKASYGLGAIGKDMVYMLSASYVLYYFQDICGVSAVAMGIILMAARVFDLQ